MSAIVKLDTVAVDRIVKNLDSNFETILEGIAFEIERTAKPLTRIRTGALRGSIHTRTRKGSTLQGFPNPEGAEVSDLPSPSGNVIAIIGTGVEYAVYQELGTSRMSAQPFLGPAVESVSRKVNEGTFEKLVA
jgi:HK97 gp10 family phage protein